MEDKYTDFQYWKNQYGSTPVQKLRDEYNAIRPQLKGRNAVSGKKASILKAKLAALNWHLNEAARLPQGANRLTSIQPTAKVEDVGKTAAPQPKFTAGSGNKVAGTQVQTSSPSVIPGARGILEKPGIPKAAKSTALAIPQDMRGVRITPDQPPTPPSRGGQLAIPGGSIPRGGALEIPRGGALTGSGGKQIFDAEVLDDVVDTVRKVSKPVEDFIDAEIVEPAKSAIKALPPGVKAAVEDVPEALAKATPKGMQWIKKHGKWGLIPLIAGAAWIAKENLQKQPASPKEFKPDIPPTPTPSPQGTSKPSAYPAQSKMSQAMNVGKGSSGVIDKANPADIKRAEGYMTDLMQRIAKGGWDQPGQERRGTQIGTPGSDKIVQMFKDSKYSDQFTQVEQEEAIKRFKANFARQSFKGSNAIPQGRTVTPTAKYTGSPERW